MAGSGAPSAHGRVARLDDVPIDLFLESQNHQDDLLRELKLIDLGERFQLADGEVPPDLAALIGDILGRYAGVRSTTRAQAIMALREGRRTATLLVPLDDGIVDALRLWLELLDTADRICATGRLLTLPARPEIRELRRWYVEQVVNQALATGVS